ncbi:hypothetical protein [Herbiconiux sp.]|uniref:hypothetical protein n=1 Tax=Herbiconiux sp. TaxID=1871186 RepID=UPI0025C68704|nr:hypothetical protein [Herbiconiux sp.]
MRIRRAPSQIRHGRLSSRSPLAFIARRIAIGLAVLAVSAGAVITVEAASLAQTFGDHAVEIAGEAEQAPPPFLGAFEGGFTMLVGPPRRGGRQPPPRPRDPASGVRRS